MQILSMLWGSKPLASIAYTNSKIITTIGPASASTYIVSALNKAGATEFRINLSHSDNQLLEEYYQLISISNLLPSLDTQGPQLRVVKEPYKASYKEGDIVTLSH